MSFNYSLGRDSTVVLIDNLTGVRVDIQYVQDFDRKQDVNDIMVKGLDGKRHQFSAPEGWSGGFTATRKNPNFDTFWAQYESDWYNNDNARLFSVFVYTNEKDGTQTVERYTEATLKYDDAGKLAQDSKPVEMKVSFKARERIVTRA